MTGFDVENRLSQVVGTGGGYSGTATYVYDGDGNRIKKTEGGSTVVYPNKYYEKNVTSDVVTSHYYLGGQQIAIKKGSTLEHLHQDSLNSSSLSTDSSGNQVSKTVFFAFGAARSSTGTLGTDQKYTGQRLDGTGLYFYNARYYDASIGRFISPDNIVTSLYNPQTFNRYSYVTNNPLRYTDPTGHANTDGSADGGGFIDGDDPPPVDTVPEVPFIEVMTADLPFTVTLPSIFTNATPFTVGGGFATIVVRTDLNDGKLTVSFTICASPGNNPTGFSLSVFDASLKIDGKSQQFI